jgi:hypothetical protein
MHFVVNVSVEWARDSECESALAAIQQSSTLAPWHNQFHRGLITEHARASLPLSASVATSISALTRCLTSAENAWRARSLLIYVRACPNSDDLIHWTATFDHWAHAARYTRRLLMPIASPFSFDGKLWVGEQLLRYASLRNAERRTERGLRDLPASRFRCLLVPPSLRKRIEASGLRRIALMDVFPANRVRWCSVAPGTPGSFLVDGVHYLVQACRISTRTSHVHGWTMLVPDVSMPRQHPTLSRLRQLRDRVASDTQQCKGRDSHYPHAEASTSTNILIEHMCFASEDLADMAPFDVATVQETDSTAPYNHDLVWSDRGKEIIAPFLPRPQFHRRCFHLPLGTDAFDVVQDT